MDNPHQWLVAEAGNHAQLGCRHVHEIAPLPATESAPAARMDALRLGPGRPALRDIPDCYKGVPVAIVTAQQTVDPDSVVDQAGCHQMKVLPDTVDEAQVAGPVAGALQVWAYGPFRQPQAVVANLDIDQMDHVTAS